MKRSGIEGRKRLRIEAEAIARKSSSNDDYASRMDSLVHELFVHKIELEMQNEELQKAQIEMEEARDRYFDLYEFAPIAYITIGSHGGINEVNLTASMMLEIDRAKLINRRFSLFISDCDKDHWYRLFMQIMKDGREIQYRFPLKMIRANNSEFHAFFTCMLKKPLNTPPLLLTAITDLSHQEIIRE